jgi:hypothetical protein
MNEKNSFLFKAQEEIAVMLRKVYSIVREILLALHMAHVIAIQLTNAPVLMDGQVLIVAKDCVQVN